MLGLSMGAEQREAMWERSARRDMALARWGVACATICAVSLVPFAAQTDPAAKETSPGSRKTPDPVRLPGRTRGDTGRVAEPRTLHVDSKIEGADVTQAAGERVVAPIPSASMKANPGDAIEPPPFQDVPTAPAAKPLPQPSAIWQAPTMPWTESSPPAPSATPIAPVPMDAGTAPDLKSEPPAEELKLQNCKLFTVN